MKTTKNIKKLCRDLRAAGGKIISYDPDRAETPLTVLTEDFAGILTKIPERYYTGLYFSIERRGKISRVEKPYTVNILEGKWRVFVIIDDDRKADIVTDHVLAAQTVSNIIGIIESNLYTEEKRWRSKAALEKRIREIQTA